METMNFITPDGDLVGGYELPIYFGTDGVKGAHKVWIVVDERADEIGDILADEAHPDHDAWEEWDVDMFYYFTPEEFAEFSAKGGDGEWFILKEGGE